MQLYWLAQANKHSVVIQPHGRRTIGYKYNTNMVSSYKPRQFCPVLAPLPNPEGNI